VQKKQDNRRTIETRRSRPRENIHRKQNAADYIKKSCRRKSLEQSRKTFAQNNPLEQKIASKGHPKADEINEENEGRPKILSANKPPARTGKIP